MAVVSGDYVDFVVRYEGNTERCRITEAALLDRERVIDEHLNHGQLIANGGWPAPHKRVRHHG